MKLRYKLVALSLLGVAIVACDPFRWKTFIRKLTRKVLPWSMRRKSMC